MFAEIADESIDHHRFHQKSQQAGAEANHAATLYEKIPYRLISECGKFQNAWQPEGRAA
jgi:hypothetical protein